VELHQPYFAQITPIIQHVSVNISLILLNLKSSNLHLNLFRRQNVKIVVHSQTQHVGHRRVYMLQENLTARYIHLSNT
jgi:hypothetical protein